MKQSQKKMNTVKVRVHKVTAERVPVDQGNISIDAMRNGRPSIPKARCSVTFIDEQTGELFVFSIGEIFSEKFKIGDLGILKYSGNKFISFSNEKVIQSAFAVAEEDKGKAYKKIIVVAVSVMLLFFGLTWLIVQKLKNDDVQYEIAEEHPLVIYLSGGIRNYGQEDEYITSWYQLGDMPETTEKWGDAYIFRDAIEQYKQEANEEIVIQYFSTTNEMLETAYVEWKHGRGPDVLIGDYTQSEYSLYPYIQDGMFENLLPYFEQDEIYSGDQYVSKVLEGGLIGDKQLVFPLTFNMNVLFTSKERMQQHDIYLSEDMYYEDLLDLFRNGWREERDEDEHLMVQFTHLKTHNYYPYVLFQAASGESPIDYESGEITLSKKAFLDWATLYQSYACYDYNMSRDELRIIQKTEGLQGKKHSKFGKWDASGNVLERFDLLQEDVLCFAEGGNCSSFYHSFAANARYFESRMKEYNEELVCIGIPTINNPDGFSAQITTFGVVLSGTSNTLKGYEFIKTLADSEPWMYLDLTVNKNSIEKTLSDLSSSYYDYYPSLGRVSPPKGETVGVEWLGEPIKLVPMTAETKEYMEYMIHHIEVAKLPEFGLNNVITEEIEEYLWGDTETINEAYNNTIQRFVELGYHE